MLDITIITRYQPKQYFKDVEYKSSMNTNKFGSNQWRLNKFVESKHRGTYFYFGEKGEVYYLIYVGIKLYY